jgi:hypothetical protein
LENEKHCGCIDRNEKPASCLQCSLHSATTSNVMAVS